MKAHAKETLIHFRWSEAKYLDLWSIVHVLFGVMLGIVIPFFGFSFLVSVSIAVILLLAWELFESAVGIGEFAMNKFIDLLVGMIGYFIALNWVPADKQLVALIVILLIITALNWTGFQAYKRRVRRG